MIDMAQVQGQVHAQSMQKVGELAERNPHETVAIVRQWLQDARPEPMAAAAQKHPRTRNEIADLVATLAGRQSGQWPGPPAHAARSARPC